MNHASANISDLEALPPLVQRFVDEHDCPIVDTNTLDTFLADASCVSVLFFCEDPKKYPETNDVAVVLPELLRHFKGHLRAAVVARKDERRLQELYGFQQWPTLVFLRGHGYLGAISRIQDWHEYLERIESFLRGEPTRPPSIGVPVVGA